MASRGNTAAWVAGGIAGVTAVLNTARVLAERSTVSRLRKEPDPAAGTPYGKLEADRHYTVTATDGTSLYVEEVGDQDAPVVLVFAHGYCLNMGSFHYQRLGLAEIDDPPMRMVFYDQRSHGRSGRSHADECTIDQLGADLEQVVRAATDDDQQVILVGHSMGGMTVMSLADLAPKLFGTKVIGVALLSTSAGELTAAMRRNLPAGLLQRVLPALVTGARVAPATLERARALIGNAMWLAVRRFSFGPNGAATSLADYVDRMIADTPVSVVADFYPTLAGHDKLQALGALSRTTTLIVCGDEDRITPIEHSELLATELPAADFFVVPGAGHMAMLEEPELVNDQLLSFIRRATEPVPRKRKRMA